MHNNVFHYLHLIVCESSTFDISSAHLLKNGVFYLLLTFESLQKARDVWCIGIHLCSQILQRALTASHQLLRSNPGRHAESYVSLTSEDIKPQIIRYAEISAPSVVCPSMAEFEEGCQKSKHRVWRLFSYKA